MKKFNFLATGLVYWKREDSEYSNQGSVRYWYRAPSAEVEMTAYVLLALLAGEEGNVLSEAQPIVQWITAQRNSYGGFSSTQVNLSTHLSMGNFF